MELQMTEKYIACRKRYYKKLYQPEKLLKF